VLKLLSVVHFATLNRIILRTWARAVDLDPNHMMQDESLLKRNSMVNADGFGVAFYQPHAVQVRCVMPNDRWRSP